MASLGKNKRKSVSRKKVVEGKVLAVCISRNKGEKKSPIDSIFLKKDWGIEGDAHAGEGERQVSLLAYESIQKMKSKGLSLRPGDFAENITTSGVGLMCLNVGSRLIFGDEVELEITQIGKECHERCAIYYQAGFCVMPEEGVFARVLKGGKLSPGEKIRVIK